MSTNFQKFKNLHTAGSIFVLPNAWDAKSATIFEETGYSAVGTSSSAVAGSLGYADGEGMPFESYLFVIKRILASVKVPVTVDLEMGYGKTNEAIFDNISRLIELGVVGINIEDSVIDNSKRSLGDANIFADRIAYISSKLSANNLSIFINIRCDTYLLNVEKKQKETLQRLKLYEKTGASGIFLPCITDEADIAEAVDNTLLAVNVMCIPGISDFATLNKLGVKRASMGPFLFHKTYGYTSELAKNVINQNHFAPIL